MCVSTLFWVKNKYITQKRAARDQQAAPFCEGGNKMKAEKTPLRYIVQRIMRTILKSETGEKDLQRRAAMITRSPLLTVR